MEERLALAAGTVLAEKRYRIDRLLRKGGMGAVYAAADLRLRERPVAVKQTFADDEYTLKAFKHEAELLAHLRHEAFPIVSDYFPEGGDYFLVMELVEGDDLDELLTKRGRPFEPAQVLAWAEQLLAALEELHAQGVVHRDIKPANLKLTPTGKLKLLDFGLAKGGFADSTTVVGRSIAAATLRFAPLEQVLKANEDWHETLKGSYPQQTAAIMQGGTDATSDLYALAATLYQLLTNTPPANAPMRALAIWSGRPDPLKPSHDSNPQVSPAVSEVLQQAMALDRRARPQSAAEMRRSLQLASKPAVVPAPIVPDPDETEISKPQPMPDLAPETVQPDNKLRIELPPIVAPSAQPKSFLSRRKLLFAGTALPLLLLVSLVTYFLTRDQSFKSFKTLTGHSDYVRSVAFAPDGKTLASGSHDNTIKLWDVGSGTLQQTLTGHSEGVISVAFAPDGKTLASGSQDSTIKLWDVASGRLRQTLTNHSDVWSVAFAPDGKTLASGSGDYTSREYTIKLWDMASGTLRQTLTGHSYPVWSVAFAPDGKTLASGSIDKTIKLWDVASGTLRQTLPGHSDKVYSVAFAPDGKTLASRSEDKTIKLWDVASGTLRQTLTDHSYVTSVAFAPDGKILASGSGDKTIKFWDIVSGTLRQTLTDSTSVGSVAFAPDGKTFASGSGDNAIKLWRVE